MFKNKKSNKSFRQRRKSSDSESENDEKEDQSVEKEKAMIEEAKEMRRLRKRQHGVSADELAVVQIKKKVEKAENDPFKIKTGGFVDMKTIKQQDVDDDVKAQIGTAFASETNRRDEDAEMVKYVEQAMSKRKGEVNSKDERRQNKNSSDTLYELPEHIKSIGNSKKRSEDMLSNQMLSGIPEVDLGIMAKIKNIEATEDAKQKLVEESMRKKEEGVSLVPTNYAVNFVQHNRFNIEDSKPTVPTVRREPVRVGDAEKKKSTDKATDDLVYDKFKKHMRRF